MILGVDGKRLIQARTGPARWLEHMLRRWAANGTPFEEVRCYTPGTTDASWSSPPRVRHVPLPTRLTPILWENVRLRRAVRGDDVLFGASYTLPVGYRGPSVVSIQGIYEGKHAEPGPWWHRYRYSALYRQSARQADLVLANSVSTKNDIVEYYGVDPDKIRIVYQGVGEPFGWRSDRERVREQAKAILGFEAPYFLFVGKLSLRRHVPTLLAAFREAMPRLPAGTRFALVGPDHVGLGVEHHIRENSLEALVTHIPHLPQDQLAVLYSGAIAFVLPTTHEGLSATMLEAMACGAPVITVDHAPLHEGLFEHVWALEAPDLELLREAMVRVATDPGTEDDLRRKGLDCAARFSWDRTAKETARACWEVANR